MNIRIIIPIVLLALVAGGTYWSLTQSSSEDSGSGLGPGVVALTPDRVPAIDADLISEQKRQMDAELASTLLTSTRQSAQAQGSKISVRIALPEDSPYDPSLRIVAFPAQNVRASAGRKHLDALSRGEDLEFPWSSAPVNPDGTATLSLSPEIENPNLVLDGEFLYLEKGVPIEGQESIELQPKLGASLQLTMTTPDGTVPEGEVRLMGANLGGQGMGFSSRISPVQQTLFRGLVPELNWMVMPQLEEHFSHGKLGVKLATGQRREITLDLMFGCLVEGTVTDDDGEPIPKITVNLVNKQPWARMVGAIETKTDANGQYSLGRVGPGSQTIEAKRDGHLDVTSPELDLVDGETREGVQLVLSLGASISGTVFDPEGKPARKVAVSASHLTATTQFGPSRRRSNQKVGKSISDKDGHFKITGLKQEKYTIQAKKSGRGSLGGKANLRADQAAVEAGVAGLRLDLQPPLILSGRVVDDQDQPVTAFRVRGKSVKSGGPEESDTFDSEDGTFQFEKLGEGRWTISVSAEGFDQKETYTVRLPRSEGPLLVVLNRECTIAGQVLSPSGSPIPGAIVRADNGSGTRGWGMRRGPQAEADKEGVFLLEGLAPGTYNVVAANNDWADSEKALVPLAAGVQEKGLVLQLRTGGSLSGIVLEANGSPMSGRRVHWGENTMGFGNRAETKTDSAGRFRFKNVTPGQWQVSAAPSFEEMGDRMQGRGGAEVMGALMDGLLTQTVEVFERENTNVELGGEPKEPIKVVGRVLYQGQPVESAEVYAVTEGKAIMQGMKSAKSAGDGTFELTLDRPDAYVFSAQAKGLGMEILMDVPSTSEWSIELVIPSGGIAGIVLNPDGDPAPGIRLSLQRNDGLGRVRWQGSQATSDVAGQYSFEGLEPGDYTVRANTAAFNSGNTNLGSEMRGGLRVTDDGMQSANFRLKTPGTIIGAVRGADGAPQAGVSIFFRDESGNLVKNLSRTQTDASGQFLREGLTPGAYTVSARSDAMACEDTKQVTVREAKNTQVQLTLDNATVLRISLENAQGVPQRLRTEVTNSRGLRVENGMTPEVMRQAFRQGTSSSNQRVGPLPPGKYMVRGFAIDGRMAEKEITLTGREKEETIALKVK
ncbi:MAG: protocatechuate 3,4-dioxygenase beta subunit [Planctomycetota bacterium]|jgi:protocatechuate 3,4-dioxygenase beta subunit